MTVVGSPAYMAPEVLQSSKYTEKADVYSFGIVCSELCTGRMPYEEEGTTHFLNLADRIINGLRPTITDLPALVTKLINDCWQADADKRPSFSNIISSLSTIISIETEVNAVQLVLSANYRTGSSTTTINKDDLITV